MSEKKLTRYETGEYHESVPTEDGRFYLASDADALLAERDAEIVRLRDDRHNMAWKLIEWAECKHCGGDAECLHATRAYDGDMVRCMDCGCPGIVSADIDETHVNWHDPSPGECDCWWCRAYDAESQLAAHHEAVRAKDAIVAAYRKARAQNGLCGRGWDSREHADAELALHNLGEPGSTGWHLNGVALRSAGEEGGA